MNAHNQRSITALPAMTESWHVVRELPSPRGSSSDGGGGGTICSEIGDTANPDATSCTSWELIQRVSSGHCSSVSPSSGSGRRRKENAATVHASPYASGCGGSEGQGSNDIPGEEFVGEAGVDAPN